MSSPEESRAIRLVKAVGLSVKTPLGQHVKSEVIKLLREERICPSCQRRIGGPDEDVRF